MNTPRDKNEKRYSSRIESGFFGQSLAASTVVSPTHSIDEKRDVNDHGIDQQRHAGRSDSHPIDVKQAKEDFAQLQRSLTKASLAASKRDVESSSDDFNLRDYFSTSIEANDAHGTRHKHVGVAWTDLRVDVVDIGSKFFVQTLPHAITATFLSPIMFIAGQVLPKFGRSMPTKPILQNFNGVLKPGEICLVLGVPGSGCTTFLKTIANQRGEYVSVTGDVRYAGIDHAEMAQSYSGEVVYNQEDDIHIPTLTVEQTIEFALSTKTPSKRGRLPGVTGKAFNEEVLDMLLKMLNITHTKKTLVGNAFVRGVSGGERKRVSILEMMATRAHVVSYDNSTRGLDASTALDFVKGLRVTTDILGQTTFVSLYQAGENIYNLVDKVLVIDAGRTVYFGPAKEARGYFNGLGFKDMPRQATADYLTACTDPNERQPAPGANPPSSPLELEQAFMESKFFRRLEDERDVYEKQMAAENHKDQQEFRQAVLEDKKSGVSRKNPYTLGFVSQVKELTKRQFFLQWQDKFTLYTSFGTAILLGIIIGATFYLLPPTTSGGFTRGSIMFLAMFMNFIEAFAEMPTQMVTRPIFLKQTSYKLFRPAALSFANTVADLPFSAVRVLLFDIIVYFMTGLVRNGGAFWTFHIFIYMAFLTMQGFFRTIGIICPNFDSAFRIASLLVPNMISYTGYLIPRKSMRKYIFWIYWINPMAYSFSGVMENEYGRLNLECDGAYITPRNGPGQSTYPSGVGPNQVCTFFGAQSGNPIVSGKDYIDVAFGLKTTDLWKLNFVVLVVMFLFFQFTQAFAMEIVNFGGNGGIQIFVKEDKETKVLNEQLRERAAHKDNRVERKSEFKRGKTLTWKEVNYVVPVPGGQRRLLHDVTGYVKSGQLVALMGASGAGKTTALDVLAQRKNIGTVTGEIFLEGKPLSTSFARETAYAEQMDVHEGTTTVREAMRFSAYLRQPHSVPIEDKNEYVESIIELLELNDLSEALVMTLGVEARKRLTIGVELASRPSALLFLDEPTSGLDAQSAFNLVRFLRKLAAAGQSIICTIHQPSALLFENFDRLLLLESGGETVYFGDIGPDSKVLRDYLARNGAQCPEDANSAEFMLEAIGAGSGRRIGPHDWKDIWADSAEFAQMKQDIETLKAEGITRGDEETTKPTTYATPFLYQLRIVTERAMKALWRSPDYTWTRIFLHIVLSLFVSLTFLNLGNSVRDLQFRIFAIFWVTILPAIIFNQIAPAFIINRMIFIREASSGMYSPVVFAIGQLLAEMPWSLVCAVLYWVIMYFPLRLGYGAVGRGSGSGYFLLMIIAVEMFGVSLGQAVGALFPTIQTAVLINAPISVILTTFAGVTIPYPSMARFWRSWLYQLTPYTRVVAGLITTELKGLEIRCRPDEFAAFEPPSGQTCQQWAGSFVDTFGGYLENGNATAACQYCQYKVGDEFFVPLNMSFDTRWRDVGLIFAFFAFNTIVTIVASRYLRYAKR